MIRHRFSRLLTQFVRRPVQGRVACWALACAAAHLTLLVGSAVLPAPAQAQGSNPLALERRVKAAFLYKFLAYAEFPASAFGDSAAPVTIGVVGSDEMAAELVRVVAGRQALGRPIQVRNLREGELGAPVHLLFVAGNDNVRAARILRGAPGALMPVTECELGLQYGSVINFRIIEDRVRFDVSLDSAEKNNVKLSSRLLTVANRVVKGTS